MDAEQYQQEQDRIFLELFGSWENPVLHLDPSVVAKVDAEYVWYEAISKARHFAKKDHPIVDEFIRKPVSGVTTTPSVIVWQDYSATGAVQRDVKTAVPYIQIMHNKTFDLLWLNMTTFKGFIETQYYEYGIKKEW